MSELTPRQKVLNVEMEQMKFQAKNLLEKVVAARAEFGQIELDKAKHGPDEEKPTFELEEGECYAYLHNNGKFEFNINCDSDTFAAFLEEIVKQAVKISEEQ